MALGQAPMPNRDHTPEFWRQVATAFKDNDRVLFDLFNEPYPDNNADTPEAWRCWREGGNCQRDEISGGRDAGAGRRGSRAPALPT